MNLGLGIFETRYKLQKPIKAGHNRQYRKPILDALISESKGKCCKCGLPGNNSIQRAISDDPEKFTLQIAHIYGRNNFEVVQHRGNKFHIEDEQYLNTYQNLLYLCGKCHKEYDNQKSLTYEKYIEMLEIKKNIAIIKNTEDILFLKIGEICSYLESVNVLEDKVFDYNSMQFSAKLIYNGINQRKQTNLTHHLTNYGNVFDIYFKEIDRYKSQHVLTIINNLYTDLKKSLDSNQIIEKIVMMLKENILDYYDIIEGFISFCIYKCEVLEYDITK